MVLSRAKIICSVLILKPYLKVAICWVRFTLTMRVPAQEGNESPSPSGGWPGPPLPDHFSHCPSPCGLFLPRWGPSGLRSFALAVPSAWKAPHSSLPHPIQGSAHLWLTTLVKTATPSNPSTLDPLPHPGSLLPFTYCLRTHSVMNMVTVLTCCLSSTTRMWALWGQDFRLFCFCWWTILIIVPHIVKTLFVEWTNEKDLLFFYSQ